MTTQYDAAVQAFFECAQTSLANGDTIDLAIEHAWAMAQEKMDSAAMRAGEARFRRWHDARKAVPGIGGAL